MDDLIPPVAPRLVPPEPGSRRALEQARVQAQQGFVGNLSDGFDSTAIATGGRLIRDEAGPVAEALFGVAPADPNTVGNLAARAAAAVVSLTNPDVGELDYDKEARYDDLTAGIPYEFHDEIIGNNSIDAALRARARIMEDMARGRRMSLQDDGMLPMLAGGLFDIDLPLTFVSGGAFGAAKVARAALRAARLAGLGAGGARRVAGLASGANAGAQAGFVVGAGTAALSETVGWQEVAAMTFQSTLLGGSIGTAIGGDIRPAVRAAQEEFLNRVRTDDPSLSVPLDVEGMADSADVLFLREPAGNSVGAAQLDANVEAVPYSSTLSDPAGDISPTSAGWIDAAQQWRDDTGFTFEKDATMQTLWGRAVTSGVGSFGVRNTTALYTSNSAIANFLGGTVFESASGLNRGRATAAVRMENYIRRIQTPISRDVPAAVQAFARERRVPGQKDGTWLGSGYGASHDTIRAFNRETMLELNDRTFSRTTAGRSKHVTRAADQYERAGVEGLAIGRGRAGELPIDGFENIKDRRGYTPYQWSGSSILALEARGVVTRDNMVAALSDSYRRAGISASKDAQAVARAVINRAVAKDTGIDTSMISLLSGDGKEWLLEALQTSGMSKADADGLMTRLRGNQLEAGKEGFAKARNEVDMSTNITTEDGSVVQIVDLLDNDLHGVWQRYSRRLAGSAALARQGITNKVMRREIAAAMQAEQRALGETPMDGDLLDAMFSHFNGGPVKGFSKGHVNEGLGAEVAVVKRLTNLSLLERLGIAQLAEEGAQIAQNGLRNWFARGPAALFNAELRAGNRALLADVAVYAGRIGEDQHHFAPHLDLDDVTDADRAGWLRGVSKFASNAAWVQSYTSLFNAVRTHQQRTAALGVVDKVFRELRDAMDGGVKGLRGNRPNRVLPDGVERRLRYDLGLFPEDIQRLMDLIEDGVIEFDTRGGYTFVNKLNMDTWAARGDADLGEVFAASITRNINQLVQKSMAGEQDAWMHTQWGSVLTHLKTFPLQAITKQVLRNARHVDAQSMNTLLYGMATAAIAVSVRDALDGTERTPKELALAAFNYSNLTGFIPMVADPLLTMVGLEDMRFNHYGPYTDATPPVFKVYNDARRIPGAVIDTLSGTADYYDQQALKAGPFAGTYVFSRVFE